MSEDLSRDLEALLADSDIWRARILIAATELDLFSALERGVSEPDALALELGTDPEATSRLLCALKEMGYVDPEGTSYRNTRATSVFLVRSSPYYLGSWLALQATDWSAWGRLTDGIRTGLPPASGSIFGDSRRLRVLLHAAHERARIFHLQPLLAAIDLSGVRTLIDVGGGAGTYSLAFCEKYPDLQCTVFDIPAAIEVAKEVSESYASDRVILRTGDFRRDELGGPYDVAFLSNVLHGEGPKDAAALVAKIRRALRPGGRVIIRDSFLREDGTNGSGGAVLGLTLMIETEDGRTHKRSEVEDMLRDAEFERVDHLNELLLVAWVPE